LKIGCALIKQMKFWLEFDQTWTSTEIWHMCTIIMVGTKELCFACHILIFGANKKIIEHVKKLLSQSFNMTCLQNQKDSVFAKKRTKRIVAMGQVECQMDGLS
jgi:hypothetical protein